MIDDEKSRLGVAINEEPNLGGVIDKEHEQEEV